MAKLKLTPQVNIKHIRNIFFLLAVSGLSFFGGFVYSNNGGSLGNALPVRATVSRDVPGNVDFALFWKVWDALKLSYYDPAKVSESMMVEGAIKGMVAALGDPYTMFLTPSEQRVTSEDLSGNFQGIGIEIGYRGKALAVISPLPGSPAEEVGVKAGDIIVAIKDDSKSVDRSTDGISLPEAVQIIRGTAGTKVTLALTREGVEKPIIVDVTRKSINVPSLAFEYLGDDEDIAHLKLLKFGGETKKEWDKAVNDISSKNVKNVIIDLRNNPGGYLQEAVDIASEFLSPGIEVVYEESKGKVVDRLKTTRVGKLTDRNVVILINGGSASASEILSGALRDQKGVKLIGVKSFGKGTVQEPRELETGAGLHLTVAKWLTPSGVWVHENGLVPDIEVKDDPETEADEQLLAAVSELE